MIGALILIRPGMGVFSAAAFLPLACAVCYSANMLLTRLVGAQETPWASMFYAALFGSIITSVLLPFSWKPIALADIPLFALLGALGAIAQFFTIRAYSLAEAEGARLLPKDPMPATWPRRPFLDARHKAPPRRSQARPTA